VISLIPKKKKKKKKCINEEGQDQQAEATFNASCKLFFFIVHILFTVSRFPFFLPLPAAATKKTAAPPDVVQ